MATFELTSQYGMDYQSTLCCLSWRIVIVLMHTHAYTACLKVWKARKSKASHSGSTSAGNANGYSDSDQSDDDDDSGYWWDIQVATHLETEYPCMMQFVLIRLICTRES